MLPVSLDYQFLIALSVLSNVYLIATGTMANLIRVNTVLALVASCTMGLKLLF